MYIQCTYIIFNFCQHRMHKSPNILISVKVRDGLQRHNIHYKFSICGDCVPEQYKAELMYVSSMGMTVNSMYMY